MSLMTEAEAAVETATGARWIRIALKLAPYVAIAALAAGLLLTRATLTRVKLENRAAIAEQKRADTEANAANAIRWGQAANDFATRQAALKPLIVHSTDTVTRYAETPAGRAPCLGADRVRGIDDLDASLAAPTAPAGGQEAMPAQPSAPPKRR